ncbi:MAG: primosomal protein N' [Erysipelotrichaceae bacterium]|nr:primosomal protein N' [Erysipelotrichaceae bacterium]
MQIVNVWLEHPVMNLNRTFSYALSDEVSVSRGVRVRVPLANQTVTGIVDSIFTVDSLEEYSLKQGYEIKEVVEVLDEEPVLNDELYELGLWMAHETVSPNIACFQCMLPNKIKPKSNRKAAVLNYFVSLSDETLAKTEKEKKAVETLRNGDMLRSEFNKLFGGNYSNALVKKGICTIYEKEQEASYEALDIKEADYPLTDEQKQAIDKINNSKKNVILLHGLTGSGKTEVYMQLAAQKCRENKQVLILVPEISLTPQMVKRMTDRFGNNIAIYHSKLNDQQRYEQYQLVRNHKVKIVVGTRSAVFMPFDDLGLIVLDEEHDHSYKQDTTPKYHCRDVAIKRAQTHGCKVVLGSATPTLESYARAIKNVYELVELKNRIHQQLPTSHLIDMQKEIRKGNTIISSQLEKALGERLAKKQQAILLLNRRGYTTIMKCRQCGKVVQCPNCDIAMSYHKDTNKLMCHVCGYEQSADMNCPNCGAKNWNNYGLGTQRLFETIQNKFPQARILRMDADTTRNKGSHQDILEAFGRGEADILLGTQMIAKGLDYPNVTLVGIFNADALLGRTDYRSVEVTFDLIVQASGRSGRGYDSGEVYVQAYDCKHYGIKMAVNQDYISFFNEEMNYRHIGNYPPYCYMIAISFNSRNEELVDDVAYSASEHFRQFDDFRTLGPSQLPKQISEYRRRIVLKGSKRAELIERVWDWYREQNFNKNQLKIQVDVDPYVLD